MTSNATMLAKYADFLQAHKFKMLISLDGDKTHHAYRKTKCGENSFNTVISNLREVALKYPAWFNTFRYNAVYTNMNLSETKEIKNVEQTPHRHGAVVFCGNDFSVISEIRQSFFR